MDKWKSLILGGGRHLRFSAVAAGVLVAMGGVALTTPVAAQTGIATTKHNLGSTGTGVNKFDGTAEICVFCHTPHGADTSAAVPLWNRVLPSGTSYTTYASLGTSTLDAKTTTNVGSVSIACLSCHDGTQAMNTVINAPGSGNYSATGVTMAGTWTGANQTDGKIGPDTITNIGKDLKNDHPIGIQYGGGGVNSTQSSPPAEGATTDPDFKAVKKSGSGLSTVWWVDTAAGAADSRQKTDMILYTRPSTDISGGTAGQSEPFVECASCHDPHSTNATFLRIVNTGSAVCLACHIK